MPAKKPKPEEKPQRERFIEAAREAEADETKGGFERAFRTVVKEGRKHDAPIRPHSPQRG